MAVVLSHFQVAPLLDAYRYGAEKAIISLDLSRSKVEVSLSSDGVPLPDGQLLTRQMLDEIVRTPNGCFLLAEQELHKIQAYSDTTARMCSLMPTSGAPTLLIGGFPMHRIRDVDPWQDTIHKMEAISPVMGRVLDTTTGLGYTAIQASQSADQVITVELDPAVLEIAKQNPWSNALFENKEITQLVGDSCEVITEFADGYFHRVVHDPPTFSLGGDLYSQSFYREVFRVLTKKGRMFHYIGDPSSSFGKRITKGVVQRLKAVGFNRVQPIPKAFGVVAYR